MKNVNTKQKDRERRENTLLSKKKENRQRDTSIEEVYTKVRIKHYQNFVKNKNVCFLQSQNLIPLIPENLPSSSCLTATKIKSAFPVPHYYSTNINTTLLIPKKIKKKISDLSLLSRFLFCRLPSEFCIPRQNQSQTLTPHSPTLQH